MVNDLDRTLAEGLNDAGLMELRDDEVEAATNRALAEGRRRRGGRVLRAAPAVAGGVVVVGVIAALLIASPSNDPPSPSSPAGPVPDRFAVLDEPPVAAADVPPLLQSTLGSPASFGCDVDPAGLRRSQDIGDGRLVYVADARPDAIFLTLAGRRFTAAECIRRAELRERGAIAYRTGSGQDSPGRVVGLVVDGYDAVEIAGRSVPVEANTFVLDDQELPAAAVLTGPAGRREVLLDGRSRPPAEQVAPFGPQVADAIAREPALAGAPWIAQPEPQRVHQVPSRPSLIFPPDVSYADALRALYLSAGTQGRLPGGTTLGDPLPAGVVLLRPEDPAEGIAIDLRAPFGYDPGSGLISPPVIGSPSTRQALDQPWPDGAWVDVPKLAPCMLITRRGQTRPICAAENAADYLSNDPDVVKVPLP